MKQKYKYRGKILTFYIRYRNIGSSKIHTTSVVASGAEEARKEFEIKNPDATFIDYHF